ncbi:MAG: hypothetical protein ACTHM6_11710 [Tepidisphaeraceae bacterium]
MSAATRACRRNLAGQPKERSTTHRRGKHEAAFALGQFHLFHFDPKPVGGVGGPLAGVALVDVCQFHVLAARLLHVTGKSFDFVPLLRVGRCDAERQQVAERVDGRRSSRSRRIRRKSCTITSNTPALIHRCVCWFTTCHRRQVIGQSLPPQQASDEAPEAIEDLPKFVLALRAVLLHQHCIRDDECLSSSVTLLE